MPLDKHFSFSLSSELAVSQTHANLIGIFKRLFHNYLGHQFLGFGRSRLTLIQGVLYQPSAIEIREAKERGSQANSNLTPIEDPRAMGAEENKISPNLPLLRLPAEIRNRIYHFILPTDTCLRFYGASTPSVDRAIPRLRFHPEGPAVPLRYCNYNQRCNIPPGRSLRARVWWHVTFPFEKGILFASRRTGHTSLAPGLLHCGLS